MNVDDLVKEMRDRGYTVRASRTGEGTLVEIDCGEEHLVAVIWDSFEPAVIEYVRNAFLKELGDRYPKVENQRGENS